MVLLEDSREGVDKLLAGFTSNYARVLVTNASHELVGQLIKVKLIDIEENYIIGLKT
jgi:tRNA A37 methylthiotransferase MiaB